MQDSNYTTQTTPGTQGDGAASSVPSPDDQAVMSFLDHLEELRWTLIKAGLGVGSSIFLCIFFRGWIIDQVLLGPTRPDFFMYRALSIDAVPLELLNRTITGQFFADIGTIVVVGLIAASPIVVYYLWKFIAPALYPEEKSSMRFAAVFASMFFLFGISFGYLVLTPTALQFFAQYTISDIIVNEFDVMKYFSMVSLWALSCGLLFELPVVVYFLSKVGILTPAFLRKNRKYALLVVLILGAVLTPPDPISQIIVAFPLMLLYEFSIYVSAIVNKRRLKKLGMEAE